MLLGGTVVGYFIAMGGDRFSALARITGLVVGTIAGVVTLRRAKDGRIHRRLGHAGRWFGLVAGPRLVLIHILGWLVTFGYFLTEIMVWLFPKANNASVGRTKVTTPSELTAVRTLPPIRPVHDLQIVVIPASMLGP